MEDVDIDALGHHLKIWCDRYKCSGEVKGSKVPLNHKVFIVTSNLKIDQLFEKQPHMIEPLERRFREIHAYEGITANNEKWFEN